MRCTVWRQPCSRRSTARRVRSWLDGHFADYDGLYGRRTGHRTAITQGDGGDLVDDVHAGANVSEDGVARVVAGIARLMIELWIVGKIDEEFRRCARRFVAARHGDGTANIAQAVGGLQRNRCMRGSFVHIGVETSRLDD